MSLHSVSARAPDEVRLALAALSRVVEPDDDVLRALVRSVGPVEAWDRVRRRDRVLPPRFLARAVARLDGVDPGADLERAAAVGARLVCPGDDEWPSGLDSLVAFDAEPHALWVRGSAPLHELTDRSVAIVGARAASGYGVHMADRIAGGVGDAGWLIVSGGAVGIDAAAHRAALASGASTVVVLACGADTAYPPAHHQLLDQVAGAGAVVSEYPPGCAPMRHRFLVRNRLLAALTAGTVVVEAAVRSGALSTLRWAQRMARGAMVVPGPVTSAMSGGCHAMLREGGAVCVTGAADVLDVIGRFGDDAGVRPSGSAEQRDALGPEARLVLDATPVRAFVHPDRIAATAGLPALRVAALLNQMYAGGWVEASDAGFRLSAQQRRARRTTGGA
ncbi:MAG TPA: DNA-processing protein DprA [Mycobacteriales bacterium]|nr:DNA-processing protein DprA [Mycobacteriales bacterium]